MARDTYQSRRVSNDAAQVVRRRGLIVAETDDGTREQYTRVRRAAIAIAADRDAAVLLVDRSSASPLADPYPCGPWTADVSGPHGERPLNAGELRLVGREYLIAQIHEAAEAGVVALAWLPRHRGPAGIGDAAVRTGADLALVPIEVRSPSFLERVMGRTLREYVNQANAPVATVGPGVQVELINRPSASDLRRRSRRLVSSTSAALLRTL